MYITLRQNRSTLSVCDGETSVFSENNTTCSDIYSMSILPYSGIKYFHFFRTAKTQWLMSAYAVKLFSFFIH